LSTVHKKLTAKFFGKGNVDAVEGKILCLSKADAQ